MIIYVIFILCPRIQELESQVSCGGLWRIVLIPTLILQLGKLTAKHAYWEVKLTVMHCKIRKNLQVLKDLQIANTASRDMH